MICAPLWRTRTTPPANEFRTIARCMAASTAAASPGGVAKVGMAVGAMVAILVGTLVGTSVGAAVGVLGGAVVAVLAGAAAGALVAALIGVGAAAVGSLVAGVVAVPEAEGPAEDGPRQPPSSVAPPPVISQRTS